MHQKCNGSYSVDDTDRLYHVDNEEREKEINVLLFVFVKIKSLKLSLLL
jgi:hypothetical protein